MKRFILFCILTLGTLTAAVAQIGEHRSILAVGGGAGVSIGNVDFDPTIKQKSLLGPTFGVTMRYTCEKYFSTVCALQVELNYAVLGWKENVMNSASEPLPDTYERKIRYVQLPLLARLGWGREQRGLMFYVLAGPQFGYCLGNSVSKSDTWTLNSEGNPDRPNNVYQQYTLDPQRKFDYGLTGGMGLELSTAVGHFMLEGRYYFGLQDLYNNSKKDPFSRSAYRSIVVKCSYLFDLYNK